MFEGSVAFSGAVAIRLSSHALLVDAALMQQKDISRNAHSSSAAREIFNAQRLLHGVRHQKLRTGVKAQQMM